MWKKLLAGTVSAAVLGAGSLAVSGAVGGGTDSNGTSGTSGSSGSTSSTATTAPASGDAPAGRVRGPALAGLRNAMKVAADAIGISVEALRGELRSGKTVAAVATSNSVEPQAVIDALVAAANERIDAAVTSGKLTADRAAAAKARAKTFAERFVNQTGQVAKRLRERAGNARQGRRGRGQLLGAAAQAIGVSIDELRAALRSGQSIADVARANGVEPQAVVDALVKAAQAQMDARRARFEQRLPQVIERLVNRTFSGSAPGGPDATGGGATQPSAA